ncbi:hypothetical protein Pelo_12509 [Pelomyxa schiedti]|nr:hypothetical protein Pelo_12509 [Pelomyxa schiedti]
MKPRIRFIQKLRMQNEVEIPFCLAGKLIHWRFGIVAHLNHLWILGITSAMNTNFCPHPVTGIVCCINGMTRSRTHFINNTIDEVDRLFHAEHSDATPYRVHADQHKHEWDVYLQPVLQAYHSSINQRTGYTPMISSEVRSQYQVRTLEVEGELYPEGTFDAHTMQEETKKKSKPHEERLPRNRVHHARSVRQERKTSKRKKARDRQ